jgi:hypothetical protein
VHPKAVEGLLEESVFAQGGFPAEAPATVGPGEEARWQRHRIAKGKGGIVGSPREELLPNALLNLFQRLALCLAKVVRWTSHRAGNHSP